MPLVSVIIPTRNRVSLLQQSIKSVLDQTWPNTELIVVDEASEDETPRVLNMLSNQIDGRVTHNQPQGPSAARNAGVRASRGDYVLFLDDDDLLHPGHVEALVRAAEALPLRHLASTGWRRFQVSGDSVSLEPVVRCPPTWKASEAIAAILGHSPGCLICGPSVLWPRELFEHVKWDEDLFTNGDIDFFGRALLANYQFTGINAGMAYYRSHGNTSVSGTQSTRSVVSGAKYRLKWSRLLYDHSRRNYFRPAMQDALMRILLSACSHGGLHNWIKRIKKAYAVWGCERYFLPQPPRNRVKRLVLECALAIGGPEMAGALMRLSNRVSAQIKHPSSTSCEEPLDYSSLMRLLLK